jgi:hypothetical protein
MKNTREFISEVGRICKYKNINYSVLLPVLHKLSTTLKIPKVTIANCITKDINHLCLYDSGDSDLDFIFTVNATSSGKLHKLPCVPCDVVNRALLSDQIQVPESCRHPSFYAYSYVDNKLINNGYFFGKATIKLAAGLTHTSEQSKVFNTVMNIYRFNYLGGIANNQPTSILLNEVKGVSSQSRLLKNDGIIRFMASNDKNNILLDFDKNDIDEDLRVGLNYIIKDFGVESLTNLHIYGDEGLNFLESIGA